MTYCVLENRNNTNRSFCTSGFVVGNIFTIFSIEMLQKFQVVKQFSSFKSSTRIDGIELFNICKFLHQTTSKIHIKIAHTWQEFLFRDHAKYLRNNRMTDDLPKLNCDHQHHGTNNRQNTQTRYYTWISRKPITTKITWITIIWRVILYMWFVNTKHRSRSFIEAPQQQRTQDSTSNQVTNTK